MVTETQQSQWRKDIANNIGKALEEEGWQAEVALEAAKITSQVVLAERIGQLAFSLDHNSQVVSDQADDLLRGRDIVERLIRDIENEDDIGMSKAMAEDWAEGLISGTRAADQS